jgi:hypothetical protein
LCGHLPARGQGLAGEVEEEGNSEAEVVGETRTDRRDGIAVGVEAQAMVERRKMGGRHKREIVFDQQSMTP